MQGLVFAGLIGEEIWNVDIKCVSHWRGKYRSRSSSQGTYSVCILRRSTMQDLVVVGLIVEISNDDVKFVKVTGVQNIGQGLQVKVPAKSLHLGEALCKVWWL